MGIEFPRESGPVGRPWKSAGDPSALPAIRFLAVIVALFTCTTTRAHPIHSSYAEADFRREPDHLEIAIRLFADDAEEMLTKRAGKKISFGKTPATEIDSLLFKSVQSGFVVKSVAGEPQPLTWIGRELTDRDQHLWIYVSCPMPGGIVGARFTNRLLREVFSDQINSVRVRDKGPPLRQTTLLFPNDGEQVAFGRK
jgi:hypothetical protein